MRQGRALTRASRIALVSCCIALGAHCGGTDRPRESFGRPTPEGGSRAAGSGSSDPDTMRDAGPDSATGDDMDATAPSDTMDAASPADAGGSDPTSACVAPSATGDFSRERLRSDAATCANMYYCRFDVVAEKLEQATAEYAADRSSQKLTAARDAWRDAFLSWSSAELFQFGPAASSAQSSGKDLYQGKGLRDRIYAWPAVARCRVEEQVAAQSSAVSNGLISGRGMFAIEYALFYDGDDTACTANSETVRIWNGLDTAQRTERKAAYAAAVAKDVRVQVAALLDAWSPSGGNFTPTFVSASGYPSEQEAMTVLGWALIYIEKEVKDWKLGIPAGYTLTSPVTLEESPYAHVGTEAIRANLRGFRALFQGCANANGEGIGFDDWLIEAGHAELADEIIAAYENAQRVLDDLAPLNQASMSEIEAAYQAMRALTNLLKTDLFGTGSPLNLKLPATVEGDTD